MYLAYAKLEWDIFEDYIVTKANHRYPNGPE